MTGSRCTEWCNSIAGLLRVFEATVARIASREKPTETRGVFSWIDKNARVVDESSRMGLCSLFDARESITRFEGQFQVNRPELQPVHPLECEDETVDLYEQNAQ
jgi:hypothetical protein